MFVASSLEDRSHCLRVFPPCLPAFLGETTVTTVPPALQSLNKVATYIYCWLRSIIRGIVVMVLGVTPSPFPVIIPFIAEMVFISTVGKLYLFDKQLFYLKLKRIPFYTMIHHLELKVFL